MATQILPLQYGIFSTKFQATFNGKLSYAKNVQVIFAVLGI